jgi:hypothetical protein
MSTMILVADHWLRPADISHIRWDRGHSYTKLIVTMRDGCSVEVRDHQGSAYQTEERLLAAIEAAAA